MKTLRVALGDIAEVTKLAGFEFTKHIEYLPDGEIIAIRGLNVKKGILDLTDIKRISIKASDLLPRSKLFKNDLVLTYTGTIGEVALITEDDRFHLAPNVAVVRPSGVNPYYLYCYMRSRVFKRDFETFSVGSTQKTVPMKNIRQVEIPLLPEKTQIEIGRIISLFDDKIEINQTMNQTLEEIAKAIFKSWFVDFDPVRAKAEGRPTGLPPEISDLFPEELVDSEIGKIPKDWELKPIYDLGDYINGAAYKKFEPNKQGLGLPIIKIAELKSGITEQTGFSTVDMDKKYLVQKKDILFSWSGNPDTSIDTFVWQRKDSWLNQHIFKVVPKDGFPRSFLLQLLKSKKPIFTEIARNKQTTGLGHVTVKDLKEMQIALPALHSFDFIMKMFSNLQEKVFINEQENICLSELRDTLLPKLISGELRIPDAEKFLEEAGV